MPHQHDSEREPHAVVRVEITPDPADLIGACLRTLAERPESPGTTTHDLESRERALADLTKSFLDEVAASGLKQTGDDRVPESTRIEVVADPVFPVAAVIEAAQHLVAAIDHGIWLTYGPHKGTLHMCPRFISLCL
ncbi:hypothetical protein [Actinacidiphila sp. bgisy167]|uniref:hypothetical protein n=1 Tax=Actinacidiphila sp. bgisy167 TaxID=3413797 RepID=UPI003D74E326